MSVFRYKLFPQGPPALPPRGWAAEQGRPPRPAPLGERGLSSRQAASLPLQTSRRPEVPVALGSRLASAVPTLWGGEQVLSTFGSGFGHVMKWPHGGAAASWPPRPLRVRGRGRGLRLAGPAGARPPGQHPPTPQAPNATGCPGSRVVRVADDSGQDVEIPLPGEVHVRDPCGSPRPFSFSFCLRKGTSHGIWASGNH